MSQGVQISQSGYDLDKDKRSGEPDRSVETLRYMVSGIAIPYLRGSSISLQRFSEASKKEKNIAYVYECLHEASLLLEDLDTVDRYVIMCGQNHELHEKILNMRNHIRHDLRDNLTHESNKGRITRAKKLGVNENLLVSIAFDVDLIIVGKTKLTTAEVLEFLNFSGKVLNSLIDEGRLKGRVKNS
ncbi:hypothetical protein CVV43_02575 [Candidatus Saccharibacteria bacterium HGW-Saccharibacteria-1]|jgi:hypothetical protein|nr:MAG: hypothetical protein CVV43_02575 [Candidatus Saccharibacteria bacterium HGW-Saccharibacteria-1]